MRSVPFGRKRLHRAGFSSRAFADRDLAKEVARHKSVFFAERAADRSSINYEAAVDGHLRLVPDGEAVVALADDYRRMVEDGLLLEEAEDFATLMEECGVIQAQANHLQ